MAFSFLHIVTALHFIGLFPDVFVVFAAVATYSGGTREFPAPRIGLPTRKRGWKMNSSALRARAQTRKYGPIAFPNRESLSIHLHSTIVRHRPAFADRFPISWDFSPTSLFFLTAKIRLILAGKMSRDIGFHAKINGFWMSHESVETVGDVYFWSGFKVLHYFICATFIVSWSEQNIVFLLLIGIYIRFQNLIRFSAFLSYSSGLSVGCESNKSQFEIAEKEEGEEFSRSSLFISILCDVLEQGASFLRIVPRGFSHFILPSFQTYLPIWFCRSILRTIFLKLVHTSRKSALSCFPTIVNFSETHLNISFFWSFKIFYSIYFIFMIKCFDSVISDLCLFHCNFQISGCWGRAVQKTRMMIMSTTSQRSAKFTLTNSKLWDQKFENFYITLRKVGFLGLESRFLKSSGDSYFIFWFQNLKTFLKFGLNFSILSSAWNLPINSNSKSLFSWGTAIFRGRKRKSKVVIFVSGWFDFDMQAHFARALLGFGTEKGEMQGGGR